MTAPEFVRYGDPLRRSDLQRMADEGWTVGTFLEGDEGYGPATIKITAIGESQFLARCVAHKGKACREREHLWTLSCRDWKAVPDPALSEGTNQ